MYGALPEQYAAYDLVYYAEITDLVNGWIQNIIYLFIAAMLFSSILSILLRVLLDHLFSPLEKISITSKKIADGEYQERLDMKGEGEIEEIYGNEDLMESMLINFIDNAIRACDKENSQITLKACEENGHKTIEVIDNGKGMDKEQLSHITEAFYRVDKARSRSEGGNGLGLALCEEIAKKHKAKLCFSSVLGQGTTIKVVFST